MKRLALAGVMKTMHAKEAADAKGYAIAIAKKLKRKGVNLKKVIAKAAAKRVMVHVIHKVHRATNRGLKKLKSKLHKKGVSFHKAVKHMAMKKLVRKIKKAKKRSE